MNSIFTVAIPMKTLIITVAIPLAVFAVLITVLVLPIVLLKIEISQDVLVVRAPPLYKFTVKHNEIIEISLVNLEHRNDLTPTTRLYGHSLPGYKLGWFKLRNGSKAFLATSSNNAVVFKLGDESYLILTPTNMDDFIETLKKMGWYRN
ncbi:MAG: PH domain-containing protein [Ignisphaera sp.]